MYRQWSVVLKVIPRDFFVCCGDGESRFVVSIESATYEGGFKDGIEKTVAMSIFSAIQLHWSDKVM